MMRAIHRILPAALLVAAGMAAGTRGQEKANVDPGLADPMGLVARVDGLVRDWQPTSAERRLDDIGWVPDLCQALKLAKEHGRPLFVFTYNGSPFRENALCLQRC